MNLKAPFVAVATVIVVGCAATACVQIVTSARSSPVAGPAHPSPVADVSAEPSIPATAAETSATPPAPVRSTSSPPADGANRYGAGPAPAMPGPPASIDGKPDEPSAIVIAGPADVSAPVRPVGITSDGLMEIPEQVDTLGWYRFGPRPGASSGSMVIVGHVDSAVQGIGAFFRLHEAAVGTPIEVITGDRHVYRYTVTRRAEYSKHTAPIASLFSRTGRPRLTLITCGGAFDSATGSYLDNIVVTALPVTALPMGT